MEEQRSPRAGGTVHVEARATTARRMSQGAELTWEGVAFRVWAPERRRVELVLEPDQRSIALQREPDGHWSALVSGARAGTRYRYRLDGEPPLYPDPYSRYQPEGPHGPSRVVDPLAYDWRAPDWRGVRLLGQVIYELHVGTFTREGSFAAATARLGHLRDLGVSVIELMPLSEFSGDFGWGYDGVDLFAPYHRYGVPDDVRRFVDEAHCHGIGVILDVVYNHFGPDGNYLRRFSSSYFSEQKTEWGDALNFDGAESSAMRALVLDNVAHWIGEYRMDGLRLDATQSIFDRTEPHILAELSQRAREAAGEREIILIAENEPQHTRLIRPVSEAGYGLSALWNDDFHHSAVVALTAHNQAYYSDHRGSPQELISAVKYGYLFQGQRYEWQKQTRGTPTRGLAPSAFVAFLENHDQVANSSTGARIWQLSSPGRKRALTALMLLGPWTPMLFQGEEWNSSRPFLYFAQHGAELAQAVRRGRAEFLRQFPSYTAPEVVAQLADPAALQTFEQSQLDWTEPETWPASAQTLALYRDLIQLRRNDPVIAAQGEGGVRIDGAVLGPESLALRFFSSDERDRLLLLNLGREQRFAPAPEPLLAPPEGKTWHSVWSSEDTRYGGVGSPPIDVRNSGFTLLGHAARLFAASPGEAS